MNKALVVRLLGAILMIEAAAMLPSLAVALLYGDGDALALAISIVIIVAVALPAWLLVKPKDSNLRAREGFAVVGLGWVLLSLFGALPFVISGVIPHYVDAVFETVSGFTTTGASIMTQIEGQPRGVIFWRSFTHWIGGMGVLVFMLALLPKMTGRTSHLMRAESPGPSLSKIVPKMGDTAKILYLIYAVMTVILFVALIIAGMNPYDAAIHAVGTAGTGGFSNYALSVGAFNSAAVDMIITVFMALFGIIYYLLKRQIVDNIRKINGSLAEITGGNLDTTVDVHSNEEFASLSDDINTTVNALKHHIEEAAARIDQELEFARSIQLSALNTVFPPYPHRKDFDIYDFYLLNEDTLGILIADVSGKGIPAAMMMMQAKTLISSLANSGINVDEVFTRANDTLCEHNDANMFVTAWMGILNLKTGLMTYVNAGHNPPLMRRNDGQFAYLESPAGFVLAGWEGFQYRRQELQLAPGDQLYLYTDGVTEATDLQEALFGEEKLLAALNEYEGNEPQAMCDKVKQDVDRFVGEAPQFDDITMLSLTYKGGASHE